MKSKKTRMSKKAKAKALLNLILKSKDFSEIANLREELDYYLSEIERDKIAALLRAEMKKDKAEA